MKEFASKLNAFSWTRDKRRMICQASGNVVVDDITYWLTVNGIARCSVDDEFDTDFGRALSRNRAEQRFYRKAEKLYIKYSNRNSIRNKVRVTDDFAEDMFVVRDILGKYFKKESKQ